CAAQHGARQIEADDVAAAAAQPLQLRGAASRPAGEIQDAIPRAPRHDAPDQCDGSTRIFVVAVRIEGMILLAEPLLEPFGHSTKTSAVNVKTCVSGSRQLPAASPAL